jgi:ATP/maltotriose-dependent transcriptional regulator MalT
VDRNLPSAVFVMAAQLSGEEKEARIAELRSRLEQAAGGGSRMLSSIATWTRELSYLLAKSGEMSEAEQVCRDLLPRLQNDDSEGDRAQVWGMIADVLQARGELDEALRIRREEELPVFERLGDVREKAVTESKIADLLSEQGNHDEAEAIYRNSVIPAVERLRDVRVLVWMHRDLATILLERNAPGDRDEAADLLRQAHATAERMGIPEAGEIRSIQEREGLEF